MWAESRRGGGGRVIRGHWPDWRGRDEPVAAASVPGVAARGGEAGGYGPDAYAPTRLTVMAAANSALVPASAVLVYIYAALSSMLQAGYEHRRTVH